MTDSTYQPTRYAMILIQVRVPADLRHDQDVAGEIALAAQEFANETYGRDYDGSEPEPAEQDAALKAALDEADAALGGDSNDAEHDALYSVRETIAGILGIDTPAPGPDYDGSEPEPVGSPVADALAAVDAVKTADLAFLSAVARDYGADSTPAANLRELLTLRKLADAVRAERSG